MNIICNIIQWTIHEQEYFKLKEASPDSIIAKKLLRVVDEVHPSYTKMDGGHDIPSLFYLVRNPPSTGCPPSDRSGFSYSGIYDRRNLTLVDFCFQKIQASVPSYSTPPLQQRAEVLSLTHKLLLGSAGAGLLFSWSIPATIFLSSLIIGAMLGVRGLLNRNHLLVNSKIADFIQSLNSSDFRYKLNLSSHLTEIKSCSLAALVGLGKKVQNLAHDSTTLILESGDLTDSDIRRLDEAGWLQMFSDIDLSDNPQLTSSTLISIKSTKKLKILKLSKLNLRDDDLKQMAESGHFNNLEKLTLSHNPQITGQGLAYITEKEFENLEWLDLSYNSQLFSKHLGEWIKIDGLKKLKVIDLSGTDIKKDDLEIMIDGMAWFKNLVGINLDWCSNLVAVPANIARLTQLDTHDVSACVLLSGGPIYFRGRGLFIRSSPQRDSYSLQVKQLLKTHRAFL